MGYSEEAGGGLRASKGACGGGGKSGPLPPKPGVGVIGVMVAPGRVGGPPATEVASKGEGVGGIWDWDTGMAACRSRSSVV